jgi:pyruvate dehydrogenase E1 component alpha subunit
MDKIRIAFEANEPQLAKASVRYGGVHPSPLRALGALSDPKLFNAPIAIDGADASQLKLHLRRMLLIRHCEEKLADMKRDGVVRGPVHLGIGQEAIAVGVSEHLRSSDRVFGTHRSHAHVLALGIEPQRLFAEVTGRASGLSKGMGGSMHLWHGPSGFYGSVPIVGGTVPLAVGAALAARMDREGSVAIAYFGDGACEEGAVHESLNLAKRLKVPVIFVVENNLFSSHLHVSLRQPSDCMARFADAHGIDNEVVDGNDVLAVSRAAKRLISQARSTNTPGFLEAVTYRWRGHVDWREDTDVGVNRSAEDLAKWKGRDPIRRLADALIREKHLTQAAFDLVEGEVKAQVEAAWVNSQATPLPSERALADYVYARSSERETAR